MLDWKTITTMHKRGELPTGDSPILSDYKSMNVLFLSDLHGKYIDPSMWSQVLRFCEVHSFDRIVWNGDILDFYELSSFSQDPEQVESVEVEVEYAKKFFQEVRVRQPNALMDYNPGNHEERWERYIRGNAPALKGLKILELPNILELDKYGIEPHQKEGFLLTPNFMVFHGEVVRKYSGASAKGELEKFGISGISGHTHRLGSYRVTTMLGSKQWTEQGCLCQQKVEYITGNPNWQPGFAVGEFYNDGTYWIHEIPIINGKLRWQGKDYSQ